jgi:hypothetical protein
VEHEDDDAPQVEPPHVSESEGVFQQERLRDVRDAYHQVPLTPNSPSPLSIDAPLQRETDPTPVALPRAPMQSPLPQWPVSPIPFQPDSPLKKTATPVPEQMSPIQREKETSPVKTQEVTHQPEPARAMPPTPRPKPTRPPRPPPTRPTTRSQTRASRLNPTAHYADDHEYHFESLLVSKAANTDPDTYSWEDAMASPYREEFLQAP